MLTRTRLARLVVAAGLPLALTVGLAGCGSGDGDDRAEGSGSPSPSATGSAPPYLEVPEGVTLTEPGTGLELGEEGVIAFQRRQDENGVLAVTVDRIERTSFQESFKGWNVDDTTAARTPYFVRVTVTNAGETDLGGVRLNNVLWADDGTTLEAPNYYTRQQQPACHGGPLPEPFATGASAELCQVYFIAPDRALERVAFPPFGGLDPVTWSGEVSKVTKPGRAGKSGKKGPGGGKQGDKEKKDGTGRKGRTTPSATPSATTSASASTS